MGYRKDIIIKADAGDYMKELDKNYLAPIASKSMVDIVVSRLTEAIISGELKPGDQIPVESELVRKFGVGRNTVREAVRILVAYGVLTIRRAEGTYVCDGFSPKVLNPMVYSIILRSGSSFNELIGLREVVENGIMQMLLEKRISEEQWKVLYQKYEKLRGYLMEDPPDFQKIADADIEFHDELARSTENAAIMIVHSNIVELTKASRLKTIETVIQKGDRQNLIDTHKNLLDKLAGTNMEELYQAINDSYFYWRGVYKDQ